MESKKFNLITSKIKQTGINIVDNCLKDYRKYIFNINSTAEQLLEVMPEKAVAFYCIHLLDQQRSKDVLRRMQQLCRQFSTNPTVHNQLATLIYESNNAITSWSELSSTIDPLSRDLTLMVVDLLGY